MPPPPVRKDFEITRTRISLTSLRGIILKGTKLLVRVFDKPTLTGQLGEYSHDPGPALPKVLFVIVRLG